MKVNIGGRGRIPLVGYIAPLRDYEMDYRLANNLLRYISSYPMYEAETGIMITPSNIRGMFDGNRKADLVSKSTESQTNEKPVITTESITPIMEEQKPEVKPEDLIVNYNCIKCGKEFQYSTDGNVMSDDEPCICSNCCKCSICDCPLEDDGTTCTNSECESNKKSESEEEIDIVTDISDDEGKEDTNVETSDEEETEESKKDNEPKSEEPKEEEPKVEVVKPAAPKAPYKKKPTQGKKSGSSSNSTNNNQPKNTTTAQNKSEVNNKEGE